MKNKIGDLRDHMFAQLERLSDENLTPEKLDQEIKRAQAISDVGKVIVESAKTEVLYAKVTGKENHPKKFLQVKDNGEGEDEPQKKIERPPAEYSNRQYSQE